MKVTISENVLRELDEKIETALILTGQALANEIRDADIIPRAHGALEETSLTLDTSRVSEGIVALSSESLVYANRLYHHPEYNFHREPWEGGEGNPNAQAYWFEPWISGDRKDRAKEIFAHYMEGIK